MVITKIALPRRTFIRGMGATLALPLLDAMVPAMSAQAKAAPRFAAIYCGNGANMNDWTPATEGVGFAFSPILKPLEAFRDRTLVFTGLDNFPATDQGDSGGQHPRAAPAFMSCVHPKQTEGADVQAGTTIDQLIARADLSRLETLVARSGRGPQRRRRRLRPRVRLRLHELDVVEDARRCRCRRKPIHALSSNGCSAAATPPKSAWLEAEEDRSILDGVTQEISNLRRKLGARDGVKLGEYLDAIRDVEQRIAKSESNNSDVAVPERPAGVPETFREYAELMFDLQVLAFQADITRVSSFMMARENINRSYAEIGLPEAHHSMSHHGNNPEKMAVFSKLNTYHVETLAYFLQEAAGDPRWRRDAAGSFDRALRQRHERRQHPQQLQRPGGGRRRAGPADQGQSSPHGIRRARRWRICR